MSNATIKRFVTLDQAPKDLPATLKVVGVGGGGCNAINYMIERGVEGVEFVAINTDAQALEYSKATIKIQIGSKKTMGLGAGSIPEIGKLAAEEDKSKIEDALRGANMVFITAGMGGGTGTGAAPVVAEIAKSLNSLVIGVVTRPFAWEGPKRMKNAEKGVAELRKHIDSIIVIHNSRILSLVGSDSVMNAFDKPNEVLYDATKGIAEIITIHGRVNVDFADVRTVMLNSGTAMVGCGVANGDHRAVQAAEKAIQSPLLDGVDIRGAKSILINVTASTNFTMQELTEGVQVINSLVSEEADVIFGLVEKQEMNDNVMFTVIATGLENAGIAQKTSLISEPGRKPENVQNNIRNPFFTTGKQIDQNDSSIPAIIRAQAQTQMNQEKERVQEETARRFEHKETRKDNYEEARQRSQGINPHDKKKDDDDDSESFLRILMN